MAKRKKKSQDGTDNTYGIDVNRLRKSITASREKLEVFRNKRLDRIKQLAGRHYSSTASKKRVPINLLALYISIFHRHLAAGKPACMVSSDDPELMPYAVDFEIWMNQRLDEINLDRTVKSSVLDALLCMGVQKVGLATADEYGAGAESFAECVHLDNWVHDMTARGWYEVQYLGDGFRMNYDLFQDSDLFTTEAKKSIKPTKASDSNPEGDDRASTLSGTAVSMDESFEPYVELWDIFLPRQRKMVTISAQGYVEPVREPVDWVGPENHLGPYHLLPYGDIPDNTMPLAPTANLQDLHDLANSVLTKLGNQAVRQKTIGLFRGNDDAAAKRINETPDGHWARLDDPSSIKESKHGGPDAPTLAFYLQIKDLFNWEAGNLDALGGLSPQSKTLGQDELLKSSASQQLSEMQDRTVTFTSGVIKAIAWYEFHDTNKQASVFKKIPGFQEGIWVPWNAAARAGTFNEYNVQMEAYSMTHSTPQMKLQAITQVFSNFYAPFANMLMAQGKMVDFDKLNDTISRLGNLPELKGMLKTVDQGAQQMAMSGGDGGDAGGAAGGKSAITQRNYTRSSTQSTSRSGRDQTLSRAMMGIRSQQSEMDGASS